ncbi:MAG: hypothetical protein IJJ44_10630 [Solobacterium sp.]|nr:hypothetical protein [Solobacterium sp.]
MMKTHSYVRKIVYIAVITAILEAAKFALNAIANVELISLLTIVFTVYFGWQITLPALLIFAVIESLWWGISIWTVTYFYVWPVLILLTVLLRKQMSRFTASCLSSLFGFGFGLLCAFTTLLISGMNAAVAWWIAGIPYDLVHGVSNLVIAFVLYDPLIKALRKLNITI